MWCVYTTRTNKIDIFVYFVAQVKSWNICAKRINNKILIRRKYTKRWYRGFSLLILMISYDYAKTLSWDYVLSYSGVRGKTNLFDGGGNFV